jgi:hypothetical protein
MKTTTKKSHKGVVTAVKSLGKSVVNKAKTAIKAVKKIVTPKKAAPKKVHTIETKRKVVKAAAAKPKIVRSKPAPASKRIRTAEGLKRSILKKVKPTHKKAKA